MSSLSVSNRVMESIKEGEKPVVAVFPLHAIGHMQMLMPIVKELLERKVEVHMFLDYIGETKESKGEQAIQSLEDLGLIRHTVVSLVTDKYKSTKELFAAEYLPKLQAEQLSTTPDVLTVLGFLTVSCDLVPKIVEEMKRIKPDCILFDTFILSAYAAGKILDIPTIGYVSYPGPGCLDMEEPLYQLSQKEDIIAYKKKIYKPILEKYNLDLMEMTYGAPGPVYYSDYINIVTTIEELAQTESRIHEKRLSTFKYIGPAIDENLRLNATTTPKADNEKEVTAAPATEDECISSNPFLDVKGDIPWQAITDAKFAGKQIICLSFGTVITSIKWAKQTIAFVEIGGADSGKEFCQKLWKNLFEAFGEDPDVLFVVSVGKETDALEGEGLEVPSNFIIRQEIPQLKVLQHSDAFITHGGWNSLQESLQCGVPMLVLPGFADQMRNARKANETGVGIGIEEPYLNAPVDVLKSSLKALLHEDTYKAKTEALGRKLTAANGAVQAADVLLASII